MESEKQLDTERGEYTEEDLLLQLKPLSKNGIVRFFQKLYRRWLGSWCNFSDRHKKTAEILKKAFFFLVFSGSITVLQYVLITFLPYAFTALNDGPWGWPNVPVRLAGGHSYMIIGNDRGLGYFIAFEIAVFTAQCINFPLQRNYTYRSHGNVFVQAIWYFVGWILISVCTSALWGICNCFLLYWNVPDAVIGICQTLLTGVFSLVIFFFIFMIIFPDNVKLAKRTRAKYEKAKSRNTPEEKLLKMEKKMLELEHRALVSEREKEYVKACAQLNFEVMHYFALAPDKGETEDEFCKRKQTAFQTACRAIEEKERTLSVFENV